MGGLCRRARYCRFGPGPTGAKVTTAEIRARVNRADAGAGQLALTLTFLELDPSACEILQNAMAKRIEGPEPTVKPDSADPVPE